MLCLLLLCADESMCKFGETASEKEIQVILPFVQHRQGHLENVIKVNN